MRPLQTNAAWAAERLEFAPWEWRRELGATWKRRIEEAEAIEPGDGSQGQAIRDANGWLRDLTERMRGVRVPVYLSDSELCDFASKKAAEAFSLAEILPGQYLDAERLRQRLAAFVTRYGITPPPARRMTKKGNWTGVEDGPAIKRMTCPLWWRRRLRVSQCRAVEAFAIELGRVKRYREVYASDSTVTRREQQKRRNAMALEGTECINRDTGEVYSLAELAAKGVSNAAIRRAELMTRIAGFEAVARAVGDVPLFLTITTPSKYHRMAIGHGGKPIENKKWDGSTPREAQRYLTKLFARIRAKLGRKGIRPYGFRVAEPHHDGTPHWHILVFVAPDDAESLETIFRDYALKEDGNERGAQENRFECVPVDYSKGTATGYIAKYISKNIDGYGITEGDWEAETDAATGAQRVEAWATAWGIRQFQQVGGPPVGVWRELRRLDDSEKYGDTLAAARAAADAGNWERYVEVMGGPAVKRCDLPLRVARTRQGERYDYAKGEIYPALPTQYGETAQGAVYGVEEAAKEMAWPSRRYRWEVRKARRFSEGQAELGLPRTCVNNCTEKGKNDGDSGNSTEPRGGNESSRGVEESAITYPGHGGVICRPAHVGNHQAAIVGRGTGAGAGIRG